MPEIDDFGREIPTPKELAKLAGPPAGMTLMPQGLTPAQREEYRQAGIALRLADEEAMRRQKGAEAARLLSEAARPAQEAERRRVLAERERITKLQAEQAAERQKATAARLEAEADQLAAPYKARELYNFLAENLGSTERDFEEDFWPSRKMVIVLDLKTKQAEAYSQKAVDQYGIIV